MKIELLSDSGRNCAPTEKGKCMTNEQLDQLSIHILGTLSIDAVEQANSGHPGTPMALAPRTPKLDYVRALRLVMEDAEQCSSFCQLSASITWEVVQCQRLWGS